ncbi:T9SS-dependent M36 family metallopeptidase [Flavobacterium sp.]|uniref:T9SS-dependent M36 family metallopeptidase n=1 Tax=Flavobacterium sp. TaxID=239 RepID=UPI00261B0D8E|nr:T9SS-dependent M36 family metallopeptidase [Flavobacterium sp.]
MKKITLLLFFLLSFVGFSQGTKEKIQSYLNENKTTLGLTSQDISDWIIQSEGNSESTGINTYFIRQRYQGIGIVRAISNMWIKNDAVINGGENLISNIAQKVNTTTPSISVTDGISTAFVQLDEVQPSSIQIIEKDQYKYKLSNGNLTEDPISAELSFYLTENNTLRLAWSYIFYTQDYKHLWSAIIDATDGKLLEKYDMILSCNFGNHLNHNDNQEGDNQFTRQFFNNNTNKSILLAPQVGSYRVLPYYIESPNHGSSQLISTSGNATASPYGWHDTNGTDAVDYTITRGNNVWAQEDANGNNGTGTSPDGGSGLSFDYPYGGTSVSPSTYTPASTTNLFYMNNIMHDIWYQYGFNETNANFQQNNYGKGGVNTINGDAVFADSQDGSGINNANFSITSDGNRPRMQMFLFDVGKPRPTLTINSPASVAGNYTVMDSHFSPGHVDIPAAPTGLTQDLVLFNDDSGDPSDACSASANAAAINGKIAVIRRGGGCLFIPKVKTAQNAGAIAVIIVGNDPTNDISMGGADATVTIPAIYLNQAPGEAIITAMASGTVNAKLSRPAGSFVNSDGDFDNGVIAHEYGHGISTRLTGGGVGNCLQNAEQAGEGWSDWMALMLQIKATDTGAEAKTIGTFVAKQSINGSGIRQYPYSTDMSINPKTFANSNDTEEHNLGEFMTVVLWDLTWEYIHKFGFDPNIYTGTGGNNKVMQLVIDAFKLQPCSPSFVQFRNALIQAEQNTSGGQNNCLITEVFRRRGMGLNASSGSNTIATDQVQDFTAFPAGPNCTLGVNYYENEDMIKIYPNPSNGQINIRINQFTGKVNLQVVDLNGRVVYSLNNTDFNIEKTINLSHLQSGMYIVKIDGSELKYTKKIILNY